MQNPDFAAPVSDDAAIPLAASFTPATRADWLGLVGKTLKGADIGSLTSTTADGLSVEPLYTAETAPSATAIRPAPRGGERAWDIRAIVRHPDPGARQRPGPGASCRRRELAAAADRSGRRRRRRRRVRPMACERVLDGVMTDLAPVALDAGFHGLACAEWLAAAAKASPAAPLAFHLDPLSAFATGRRQPRSDRKPPDRRRQPRRAAIRSLPQGQPVPGQRPRACTRRGAPRPGNWPSPPPRASPTSRRMAARGPRA